MSTQDKTKVIQVNRPYCSVISGFNGQRTMSTSSKLIPVVKVYLNPDKEKDLIVNENKGRAGIYR